MSQPVTELTKVEPTGSEQKRAEYRPSLFDPDFYLSQYSDIANGGIDPVEHYIAYGAAEGRRPHPLFDPAWYLAQIQNPETARADPLGDYLRNGVTQGRSPHPLFDPQWYLRTNRDVVGSGMEPLEHFIKFGWREGRQPHPLFDIRWYLTKYPDVAEADTNPVVDYLSYGWRVGRKPNALFDVAWYFDRYSDVIPENADPLTHYITTGRELGLRPHPLFDPKWYAKTYREVAESGIDPLVDFLGQGGKDGRNPNPLFDSAWYRREYPAACASETIPLLDFIKSGAVAGRRPNPLFDCLWYTDTYHELHLAPVDTLSHYLEVGGFEGRLPMPLFDSAFYLRRYPDVAATGDNPLAHYLEHGIREGRYANPMFDTRYYLWRNTDIAQGGINPLDHFYRHGGNEGRNPCELFDSSWYLSTYRTVAERRINPLVDYLFKGRHAGRNPHPLFDDAYYLNRYPDVSSSGMLPAEHYVAIGAAEGRKPSALFDGAWYMNTYQDIEAGQLNPLVHYAAHGAWEHRWPNPLFDSDWYRTQYAEMLEPGANPLIHYLKTGADRGCRPSPFFDPDWYLKNNLDARKSKATPLEHYLDVGGPEKRDPHPMFDTLWYTRKYLTEDDDGVSAVGHFVLRGWQDRLKPNALFDPRWYIEHYSDISIGHHDPFIHYWNYGLAEGRFPAPVSAIVADIYDKACADRIGAYIMRYRLNPGGDDHVTVEPTAEFVAAWVKDMLRLGAGKPVSDPDVSIVIPVYNHVLQTMACIHSLLELDTERSFEIIVADDASTDDTAAIMGQLGGLRLVRAKTNQGFILNCNAGAAKARGRFVAFLNNDTLVLPGWLDEMVETFALDESIGLVGSKLLFGDGRLQEAGGIVWRDGSAWNYGREQDPRRPEFSYLRDVDYVSGASIMLRRDLWAELGGFDTMYDVAYGEDSDLAFRVREAGRRVVMQPWSMVLHFEGVSSGTDLEHGVKKYQVTNAKKLFERWESVLASHRHSGEDPVRERERGVDKRILVVDALTPSPDEDAGSVTCIGLMQAFQSNGYKVSFFPYSYSAFMPKQTRALQRIGIEALYHPYNHPLEEYLKEHGDLFDIILVFRNECAFPLLGTFYEHAPQAKIAFHVSDLHFVREARKAELENIVSRADREVRHTRAKEMYSVIGSDLTIVHSDFEREVLEKYAPGAKVYVFPWIVDTKEVRNKFSDRSGIAYLGGFGHPPNVDAVLYFVAEIWPKIHAARPDIVFHVVGSRVPPEISVLHGHNNIRVVGYVEDLATCFDTIRISVAPIRYGAGIKGKVPMAMSYGVPVVATSCAAEGMNLVDEESVLISDKPDAFAQAVIRLHDDAKLWKKMSSASIAFIDQTLSTQRGVARVAEMIEMLQGIPESEAKSRTQS